MDFGPVFIAIRPIINITFTSANHSPITDAEFQQTHGPIKKMAKHSACWNGIKTILAHATPRVCWNCLVCTFGILWTFSRKDKHINLAMSSIPSSSLSSA